MTPTLASGGETRTAGGNIHIDNLSASHNTKQMATMLLAGLTYDNAATLAFKNSTTSTANGETSIAIGAVTGKSWGHYP